MTLGREAVLQQVDGGEMLCGLCVEPGRFELVHRPRPEVAPEGHVLVDIDAVGLCGTDYHIFEGKHPFLAYPRVIGHELSGIVAQSQGAWRAGQRVVINPYLACGTCRACQKHKPNCCEAIAVLGVHCDGGLGDRLVLPEKNLIDASDLPADAAVLVEFLAIGAHAVRRANVAAGDRVLITGAGPIGLGIALFAAERGAEVHLRDLSPERLAQMADFGFTHLHAAADLLAPSQFDAVFDATGSRAAIMESLQYVAHGGTWALVGLTTQELGFLHPEFHKRETTLVACRNATSDDFETVMAAFTAGRIRADQIISKRLFLSELPEAFPALVAERAALLKVVVDIPRGRNVGA